MIFLLNSKVFFLILFISVLKSSISKVPYEIELDIFRIFDNLKISLYFLGAPYGENRETGANPVRTHHCKDESSLIHWLMLGRGDQDV